MNTSTHKSYTSKYSIEGPAEHEIIENVKNLHETQKNVSIIPYLEMHQELKQTENHQ